MTNTTIARLELASFASALAPTDRYVVIGVGTGDNTIIWGSGSTEESARAEAEEFWAADGQRDAEAYCAEIVDPVVIIGSVQSEYTSDGDEQSDLDAYICVDVTVDGEEHRVGCGLGVPASERGSARASGCGVSYAGGPIVWWADSSDWAGLSEGAREAVLGALSNAAGRLWDELETLRDELTLSTTKREEIEGVEFGDYDDCYPAFAHTAVQLAEWTEAATQWESERDELLAAATKTSAREHLDAMSRIEQEWGDDPSTRRVREIMGLGA
jgi:hypothetical protein